MKEVFLRKPYPEKDFSNLINKVLKGSGLNKI
jgi:hypothetical protein